MLPAGRLPVQYRTHPSTHSQSVPQHHHPHRQSARQTRHVKYVTLLHTFLDFTHLKDSTQYVQYIYIYKYFYFAKIIYNNEQSGHLNQHLGHLIYCLSNGKFGLVRLHSVIPMYFPAHTSQL